MSELIDGILAEKGDAPYIRYAGVALEAAGTYRGHDYVTVFQPMGFRCGYVSVPKSHKLFGNTEALEDLEAHWGVTYCEGPDQNHMLLAGRLQDEKGDLWIGFDAGHCDDGQDIDLALKIFPEDRSVRALFELGYYRQRCNPVRDIEYMICECKKLIDQLVEIQEAAQ